MARARCDGWQELREILGAQRREILGHLRGGLVALVQISLKAARDDALKRGRDVGADRAEGRHWRCQHRRQQHAEVGAIEGWMACDELIEHHAERPEIGSAVDVFGRRHLLGRHVHG